MSRIFNLFGGSKPSPVPDAPQGLQPALSARRRFVVAQQKFLPFEAQDEARDLIAELDALISGGN